jgi:hypothetical protein
MKKTIQPKKTRMQLGINFCNKLIFNYLFLSLSKDDHKKGSRFLVNMMVVFCAFLMLTSCTDQEKKIVFEAGIADVNDYNFSSANTEFILTGDINFYWKQWPKNTAGAFDTSYLEKSTNVLFEYSKWKGYDFPAQGYGTYHFTLKNVAQPLQLNFSSVHAACEVFINGKQVGHRGILAKNAADEQRDYRKFTVAIPKGETIEIYAVVSNHKQNIGGGLAILNTLAPQQKNPTITASLVIAILLLGSMLLFGLFHVLYFIFDSRNKSILYIALFAIVCSIRQICDGEHLVYYLFTDLDSDVIQKIHYLGFYLSMPCIMMYHRYLFPRQAFTRWYTILTTICILGAVFVIVTPIYIASYSTLVLQQVGWIMIILNIYQLVKAVRQKESYAMEVLISGIVTSIFLINDILNATLIIQTVKLMNYGLLAYVLSQIIISKKRYLYLEKDYGDIKRSSEELKSYVEQKEKEISRLLSESQLNLKSKETILNNLKKIKKEQNFRDIQSIISDLSAEILDDPDAIITDEGVQRMNHKLVVELKKRYPNLTKTEIEICVYISMKLDRKNIAKLRNTSFYTVKSTVYRVRKKMDLPPEVTLDDFIEEEIMSTF